MKLKRFLQNLRKKQPKIILQGDSGKEIRKPRKELMEKIIMSLHLSKEINRLKKMMSELCTRVEESMKQSLVSLLSHDKEMAAKIIQNDKEIDQLEIELEEECLKILALHQPVAIDLRYVIACLKMNNDLERIGDLSANIAKNTIAIADMDYIRGFERSHLEQMMKQAQIMLKNSLDALFELDEKLALQVCNSDDKVDNLNKQMHIEVAKSIKESPEMVEYFLRLLLVSRNIERIADYTTNIAEDIIYMINGEIVRHGRM
jgi:phosphate transport system protein